MKIQYQDPILTVFESALFRTTTSCITTKDMLLLVDPNWLPIEIAYIKDFIHKIKGHRPLYMLFTHSDYDHIIGYNAFPEATIIASKAFVANPKQAAILQQIKDFDDEYYIKRPYLTTYPEVDIEVGADNQVLTIGETHIHFFQAPGHNADGIFTIFPKEGIWIAGDYLSNIEFPYIYFSSYDYEKTLRKVDVILAEFDIRLLITGHGDIAVTDEEILHRKQLSFRYIEKLRESIATQGTFDLKALFQLYHFPKIMTSFHEGNVRLIKKELGK